MSSVVLGIAVGVNLLVFTVVNAIWVRPLPFADPDRVVTIPRDTSSTLEQPRFEIFTGGVAGQVLTADIYEGLRPRIRMAAMDREPETLAVTAAYFRVLGVAIRGRDFTKQDDEIGAEPVTVISDRLWTTVFGRRHDVIGTVVPASPFPLRIIGIAPPDFAGARRGEQTDVWVPTGIVRRLAPAEFQQRLPMIVIARLQPDQTVAMMDQRYRDLMNPRDRDWLVQHDPAWANNPVVVPLRNVFGTPATRTLMVSERDAVLVVSGLALLVLLGGCATIAALVLVHYERRRGELALKIALGASSARIARELCADLSLLVATGTLGGLAVAVVGLRVLPTLSLPGGVDLGRLDLTIDWRVCAVAIAITALTLAVAASWPTVRSTRPRIAGDLFAGLSSVSRSSQRLRQGLLAIQVTGTIVVLIAAGLFTRAVSYGFKTAPGFEVGRTVFFSVQEELPQGNPGVDSRKLIALRAARVSEALADVPGIEQLAEGVAPISSAAASSRLNARTVKVADAEHRLWIGRLPGSSNLLTALGIPVLTGRHLTSADSEAAPVPAVITKSLAERLWPTGESLGRTLSVPQVRGGPYLVVGIAPDVSFGSLTLPPAGVVVTTGQSASRLESHFVIRTEQPERVAAEIPRRISGYVVRVATGREVLARDLGRQRLGAWFFSGFGSVALVLGVVGVFGLVAYLVETQRKEFGVRLALGATAKDLVRRGAEAALFPVGIGVCAGLAIAALASQLLVAMLAGISPLDPATYIIVAATMSICAGVAALSAAWRLRKVSPSDALRAT